jgi:hypothetical protein
MSAAALPPDIIADNQWFAMVCITAAECSRRLR